MSIQMTEKDIVRLGRVGGIELTPAERESIQSHIQKQLHSFEALNDINTDGVNPTFDLAGKGRFVVGRCDQ